MLGNDRLHLLSTAGENYSSSFLRLRFSFFTRPASLSGIFGTLLLPLMLLTTIAKKKILLVGIQVYSRGIAAFTEQWTAFTRARSTILQSRDFNLRYKFLIYEAYMHGM